MAGTLTYKFYRLFWSIYFVLTIAIVGLIFGYFVTLLIFSLAPTTRCEKNFLSTRKFGAFFFTMAIESNATIVPIALSRTDQVMGRGDFLIHPYQNVKIKMLEPIRAEEFQNSSQLRDFVQNQIKVAYHEL